MIRDGRLGYAYAADPYARTRSAPRSPARENAALAAPDEHNVLPRPGAVEPMPELFRAPRPPSPPTTRSRLALDLETRAVARDPRVTKVDPAQVGDAVSRVAIASTTGVEAEYERTDAWVSR